MLFSNADDVHASLGRLLQELAADAEFAPRLMVLDTVLQFRFRKPDAIVTLTLRGEDAPAVALGQLPEGAEAPEIVVTLDADVAHALWRGQHNVAVGLARGTIQAKGETTRIVELLRLTDEIAPRYDQLLRGAGRDDLADAEAPAQTATAAETAAASAASSTDEGGADAGADDDAASTDAEAPTDDASGEAAAESPADDASGETSEAGTDGEPAKGDAADVSA
ncbi:MAG: hypothetical protein ITG02_04775 [Patulibacter sp.]|nr:hypothetical protein [Patulibacter sp.]